MVISSWGFGHLVTLWPASWSVEHLVQESKLCCPAKHAVYTAPTNHDQHSMLQLDSLWSLRSLHLCMLFCLGSDSERTLPEKKSCDLFIIPLRRYPMAPDHTDSHGYQFFVTILPPFLVLCDFSWHVRQTVGVCLVLHSAKVQPVMCLGYDSLND